MLKDKLIISLLIPLAVLFFSCANRGLEKLNKTYNTVNESDCSLKGGYWYKEKCWASFKEIDQGISMSDIDSVVKQELIIAQEYKVVYGKATSQVELFISENEKETTYFVGKFKSENEIKSFLIQFKGAPKLTGFMAEAAIIKGDIFSENAPTLTTEEMKVRIIASGTVKGKGALNKEREFIFSGSLTDTQTNQPAPFSIQLGEGIYGIGDTTIKVSEDKAYLNGTLGTKTYQQIKDLIRNHPEVTILVLDQVPGSVNDDVNMHTGRIIREAGLTTELLPSSVIASGGVDLFCAGKQRIIAKGAKLGIHSWGAEDFEGSDFPKDHPIHQYQIAYFTMCLGPQQGPEFYFKTLTAAPANDIYWMTENDLAYWRLATDKHH